MDTLSDHIGFPKVFNDVFRDKSSDIVEKSADGADTPVPFFRFAVWTLDKQALFFCTLL